MQEPQQAAAPYSGVSGVLPTPTSLNYATPLGAGLSAEGVWQQGKRLVTTRVAMLPRRCIKCNAEADGFYRQRTFYWAHPAWLLLILVNVLVLLIVHLCVRKKSVITVGLCKHHSRRRLYGVAATWALALGGIAAMVGGALLADEFRNDAFAAAGMLGGLVLIIVSIFTGVASRLLVPTCITTQHAWFKGCGSEFLSQFPSVG